MGLFKKMGMFINFEQRRIVEHETEYEAKCNMNTKCNRNRVFH